MCARCRALRHCPLLEMLEFSTPQLRLWMPLQLTVALAACGQRLIVILLHERQTEQSSSILRVITHDLDKCSVCKEYCTYMVVSVAVDVTMSALIYHCWN